MWKISWKISGKQRLLEPRSVKTSDEHDVFRPTKLLSDGVRTSMDYGLTTRSCLSFLPDDSFLLVLALFVYPAGTALCRLFLLL
jgi:hypothetical protein